jgi:mono/diheme cytochrome c family protein
MTKEKDRMEKYGQPAKRLFVWSFLAMALIVVSGCDLVPLHMRHQPYYRPLVQSTLFEDGAASRPLPANTIPRGEWGELMLNEALYTGKENGEYIEKVPIPVTQALLERGQERYDIFCSPCHSRLGDGQGMIVQRGFPQPPSYHTERLRQQPDGYYYDVITNGFGKMYSYASRIHPEDRWAIVAYIRALQLSQNFPVESLPESDLPLLESQPTPGESNGSE